MPEEDALCAASKDASLVVRASFSLFCIANGIPASQRHSLTSIYKADSAPDARAEGYGPHTQKKLNVALPPQIAEKFSESQRAALREALAYDPRPGYQNDPQRVYGFAYGGYDIRFQVSEDTVTVTDAVPVESTQSD